MHLPPLPFPRLLQNWTPWTSWISSGGSFPGDGHAQGLEVPLWPPGGRERPVRALGGPGAPRPKDRTSNGRRGASLEPEANGKPATAILAPAYLFELCCLARMYLPRLCVSRPISACPDAAPRASPGGGGAGWGAGLEGASHRRFSSAQAPPSPDGAGGEHVPRGEPHRAAWRAGFGDPLSCAYSCFLWASFFKGVFFVNTGLAAKVRNSARFFG